MSIAVIDLKSFYASCECICRHLNIFETPLVCCDPYRSGSSVVMSVTPYLKEKYGVPNVCRKRDLPNIPGMIYAIPRMSYYLQVSARVVSIFLEFVAKEDIHVYSVDESFINLGPYLKMYGCGEEELVQRIQNAIHTRLGLVATAGIGPNMFLAKVALDAEGKKRKPFLAKWDYSDVPTKLWNIHPITKIWGISHGISSHLARIGIRTLRELAHADDRLLQKEFGVMGYQLKNMANGQDGSDIQQKYTPKNVSLSSGQTLRRPHDADECLLLLREMTDEVASRARARNYQIGKVSVWASYGMGGCFSKQFTMLIPTDSTNAIYDAIRYCFMSVEHPPIFGLGVAFGNLQESEFQQISLWENPEQSEKERNLDRTLDQIKEVFGKNSVLRCSSLLSHSTIHDRNQQIGGHRA